LNILFIKYGLILRAQSDADLFLFFIYQNISLKLMHRFTLIFKVEIKAHKTTK